jgi:hypothetical protein
MSGQVIVTGRIEHSKMLPDVVLSRILKSFPKVKSGGSDFILPLPNCEVEFFCASTTSLEFSISPTNYKGKVSEVSNRTVTSAEVLIRATESLWTGLEGVLRASWHSRRPRLKSCNLEDPHSLGVLLTRDTDSPLCSPGAKFSWWASVLLVTLTVGLVIWQLHQPESDARTSNLLGIIIGLGGIAVGIPIPTLINWRNWKKSFVWKYVRAVK